MGEEDVSRTRCINLNDDLSKIKLRHIEISPLLVVHQVCEATSRGCILPAPRLLERSKIQVMN